MIPRGITVNVTLSFTELEVSWMARPSKPKPAPIEPRTALRRLAGRYGPTAAYDVVQDALSDVQAGKRSGRRDGDDALVLDALAVLPLVRDQMDSIERELLQVGHEDLGLTMAQLAPALGVKTRQAAEQRYQRKVHGASGANLSDARQRRRARTAFAAWLDKHQADVVDAVAGLLSVVEEDKKLGTMGARSLAAAVPNFETAEAWDDVLDYAHTVAKTVQGDPGRFGPDVVHKADRVVELYGRGQAAKTGREVMTLADGWSTPEQQQSLSELLRKVWDSAEPLQRGRNLDWALASVHNLSSEQAAAKIAELRAQLDAADEQQ
jgi:hypothetical protein